MRSLQKGTAQCTLVTTANELNDGMKRENDWRPCQLKVLGCKGMQVLLTMKDKLLTQKELNKLKLQFRKRFDSENYMVLLLIVRQHI